MDSALVFVSLGLQVNCQGEGGRGSTARPGWGWERGTCSQQGLFSRLKLLLPFGRAGGGNAAVQLAGHLPGEGRAAQPPQLELLADQL